MEFPANPLLTMLMGAVLPSFFQGEAQRRQQSQQALSQPQAMYQPQPIGEQDITGQPSQLPQQQPSSGGNAQQQAQQQFAPSQSQAPSARSGGGIMDQLTGMLNSPVGMGGMGALGAMMLTPRGMGFGPAMGNALMGGMQGMERGTNLQNQRAQIDAQADYRRQQAEYHQQRAATEKQKVDLEKQAWELQQQVWNTLTPEERKIAQFKELGAVRNPNLEALAIRAAEGDPVATRALELMGEQKRRQESPSAIKSYMAQIENDGDKYGTAGFNQKLIKMQAEAAGAMPQNQRADKEAEASRRARYQNDLEQYVKSEEFVHAGSAAKKAKLLAEKKRKLAKVHGLQAEPETGQEFPSVEEETRRARPPLDEIFGGGPQ